MILIKDITNSNKRRIMKLYCVSLKKILNIGKIYHVHWATPYFNDVNCLLTDLSI